VKKSGGQGFTRRRIYQKSTTLRAKEKSRAPKLGEAPLAGCKKKIKKKGQKARKQTANNKETLIIKRAPCRRAGAKGGGQIKFSGGGNSSISHNKRQRVINRAITEGAKKNRERV